MKIEMLIEKLKQFPKLIKIGSIFISEIFNYFVLFVFLLLFWSNFGEINIFSETEYDYSINPNILDIISFNNFEWIENQNGYFGFFNEIFINYFFFWGLIFWLLFFILQRAVGQKKMNPFNLLIGLDFLFLIIPIYTSSSMVNTIEIYMKIFFSALSIQILIKIGKLILNYYNSEKMDIINEKKIFENTDWWYHGIILGFISFFTILFTKPFMLNKLEFLLIIIFVLGEYYISIGIIYLSNFVVKKKSYINGKKNKENP